MNKKILSVLLIIVLMMSMLIGLTACGDSDKKEKDSSNSPEEVAEDFTKALINKKAKKLLDLLDIYGLYVFSDLDRDEYEDFYDEYKDFLKSDEYDDMKEEWKDEKDDALESLQDYLDDMNSDAKIKIKKVYESTKVGKNLYKVRIKIEIAEGKDKEAQSTEVYVMKDDSEYKVVGGDIANMIFWAL